MRLYHTSLVRLGQTVTGIANKFVRHLAVGHNACSTSIWLHSIASKPVYENNKPFNKHKVQLVLRRYNEHALAASRELTGSYGTV